MNTRLSIVFLYIMLGLFPLLPEIQGQNGTDQVLCVSEDREILKQVFVTCATEQGLPVNEILITVAKCLDGKPYAAHTLETEPEQLVVNLREFDCTTFTESCLAISRTITSGKPAFEQFISELKNIRYRDGEIHGYSSRIHYFSEWISLNSLKGIVRDVSREIGGIPESKKVNFMSTHPEAYPQLKANPELRGKITTQETVISEKVYYYIPKAKVRDLEDKLREGDILGITTNIEGLDISHVGIAMRIKGRIHLMHASSTAGKVILSQETLESYLMNTRTSTGIMVARPL